jgi:hypothetical protein
VVLRTVWVSELRQNFALQQVAPLLKRSAGQILAVEQKDIEDVKVESCMAGARVLKRVEGRTARRVKRDANCKRMKAMCASGYRGHST